MRRQPETRAALDKEREFRAAARSARLRYVSDADRGFARRRRGKSFTYVRPSGEALRDTSHSQPDSLAGDSAGVERRLDLPAPNGHLQATGRDARGRKQYRYHPRWREAQDENKYERMIAFAKTLPKIRRAVARHLRKRGLPREKVLAAVVKLLETTLIRVGNDEYARDNDSFGLTTMHDEHVKFAARRSASTSAARAASSTRSTSTTGGWRDRPRMPRSARARAVPVRRRGAARSATSARPT